MYCWSMLTPDNYLKYIGAAIKAARKDAGWVQVELAAATGVHRPYIVSIENGKRKLSLLNLVKIAEELEVPLSELIAHAEALSEEG